MSDDLIKQLMVDELDKMTRKMFMGVDVGKSLGSTVVAQFEVDPNAPQTVRYVKSWIVDDNVVDSTAKVIE